MSHNTRLSSEEWLKNISAGGDGVDYLKRPILRRKEIIILSFSVSISQENLSSKSINLK